MKVFKTKGFARWARRERIPDNALIAAIREIEAGLIDAHLGSGLIKKRVAKRHKGKRGGHRVLLAFKAEDRSIFVYGFSKNSRENLENDEKELYKKLAKIYLCAPLRALQTIDLQEIHDEKK